MSVGENEGNEMKQDDFTGKWALVTGAGGGMGRTTSLELARAGANLILVDISGEAIGTVAREVEALGVECQTFCVDVTDFDQINSMADTVKAHYGAVDILVNNAGVAHMAHIVDTTIDEWKKLLDINLWSIIYMVGAFAPEMIRRKSGHIVNISSGQAFFAVPSWGAYATTKFAVDGYSEALRYELYSSGVSVSCVYPGVVRTSFYDSITGGLLVRLGMKFILATAMKPEAMSRLIVKGIRKNKKMIMPLAMRPIYALKPIMPLPFEIVGKVVARALRKER
ncbi:MAG: acetoin dehydrogenase [Candidatus Anoxymicrobium japonicum]|uniref:Acetoin dehydrogenase n=1 Tax=Candidatus Anoxymicrobium japonicum TaxID=2013648 RepID=A0A2N3G6M0_9ACTN|nr:MAG: acetoin dehydrogenase [Candidatus Anoxymicrobium japonicum]